MRNIVSLYPATWPTDQLRRSMDTDPPLSLQVGPTAVRRLDQAFGRRTEAIVRRKTIQVFRGLPEPTTAAESLREAIDHLVPRLCLKLERYGFGARKLDLLFFRVDSTIQTLRVELAKAVRDPVRLSRLLCDRLESVDPGLGIEIVMLTATGAEPIFYRQSAESAFGGIADPDFLARIDALIDQLGEDGPRSCQHDNSGNPAKS